MRIFISYRRTDTTMYLVQSVRAALAAEVGEHNVFLDIDNIPLGVDFREHLRHHIASADAVLAMIGSNWEPERLADGRDFVRIELLLANELKRVVVPVCVGGQPMPLESDLPTELRWFVWRNAFTIASPPRHVDDLTRLAVHFRELPPPRPTQPVVTTPPANTGVTPTGTSLPASSGAPSPADPFTAGHPADVGPAPLSMEPTSQTGTRARRRRGAIATAVAVLTAAAIVTVVFSTTHGRTERTSTGAALAGRSASSTSSAPQTIAPTTIAPTTTAARTTTTADPRARALATLERWMAEDLARAEALVDHWVPQVSAKTEAAETDLASAPEAIVEDHLVRRDKYKAILVSGDAFNFVRDGRSMDGWYISIVPRAFDDPDSANAWCDAQQIAWGDCFAHFLSHRFDAEPNNAYRKRP